MKKIIKTLIVFSLFAMLPVFAADSSTAHCKKAAKLLDKGEYTEAIKGFSKAITISPCDPAAKLGLIMAYAEQGDKFFLEDKEYGKAAHNYRAVLFYTLYFHPEFNSDNLNSKIPMMYDALSLAEKKLRFKHNAQNHYNTAKLHELAGEYSAAAYEYIQASKNKKYTKECMENVAGILSELGDDATAKKYYDVEEEYTKLVTRKIKLNWNPPKNSESICIVVFFQLDRDGNVLSKEIKKSNGTKEAEEAALKAIDDSAPFPKVPAAMKYKVIPIQFTFDYKVHRSKKNEN